MMTNGTLCLTLTAEVFVGKAAVSVAGIHLAHQRRRADRRSVGTHALRQLRVVEPRAPRRAGVRQRRLLAAPVGPAHAPVLVHG